MLVATLLADPAARSLDRATVAALRDAWGGGDAAWLAPGIAAEFALEAMPDNRWEVWRDLQAMGVDLCVQASAGRRKRILIADMDSTMIGQECVDELAAEAGVGAHVAAITARAMAGAVDFAGALRERVALLAGLDAGAVDLVLADRITLAPGGGTLVATMRAQGAHTALVSGGFTSFTGPVGAMLGFHESRANTLIVEDGRLTGAVADPILGREAKVAALHDITARLGLAPRRRARPWGTGPTISACCRRPAWASRCTPSPRWRRSATCA